MGEERETKILKTSNGYEIVVNTYVTGRELRKIQEVFLNEMKLKQVEGRPEIRTTMEGEQLKIAEDRAIEAIVKSVNGKTNDIISRVLDLPIIDFGEVKEYINEISDTKKKDFEK